MKLFFTVEEILSEKNLIEYENLGLLQISNIVINDYIFKFVGSSVKSGKQFLFSGKSFIFIDDIDDLLDCLKNPDTILGYEKKK